MGSPKLVSDARLEAALRTHNGIATYAAKAVGISPEAVRMRTLNNPRLRKAATEAREVVVDHAENNVLKAVKKGKDLGISKWVLERLAKSRGYGQSVEFGISEDDMLGLVAAFGGDPTKLTAFRDALGQPAMLTFEGVATEVKPPE